MPDSNKKFHEFALQSILFKGRSDWYFCYLKAEKIAHVLTLLARESGALGRSGLETIAHRAGALAGDIAHLAAGEVDAPVVLADVFSLLSEVRLLVARQALGPENGLILAREYEQVAERLARGSHPSPFVSAEDFALPALGEPQLLGERSGLAHPSVKDTTSKGHSKGQTERMSLILDLVRKRKSLSIKEIAAVIKGCSEKTIQRELGVLIGQGLIKKVGERRWSLYLPT